MPAVLEVTARVRERRDHGRAPPRRYAIEGVQFHPESIMTKVGHDLLRNFLRMRVPALAR